MRITIHINKCSITSFVILFNPGQSLTDLPLDPGQLPLDPGQPALDPPLVSDQPPLDPSQPPLEPSPNPPTVAGKKYHTRSKGELPPFAKRICKGTNLF